MKILIISQYFWPENFRINELVRSLIKKGHNIEILTSVPNYPQGKIYNNYFKNEKIYEKFHGMKVHRIYAASRKEGKNYQILINYFSFLLKSSFYVLKNFNKKNFDIVFTFAPSPLFVSILSFFPQFKNSKKVIWLLDLWPYILFDLKIINNFFFKFLLIKLSNFIYKKNDFLFVQSKEFKKKLLDIVKDKKKIDIMYGWNENTIKLKQKKNKMYLLSKKNFQKKFLNVIFTGNVGFAQNFTYLSKIIYELYNDKSLKVAWHFFGSGRDIERQKKFIKERKVKNVFYYGYVQNDLLEKFIKLSDVLLIILHPGDGLNSTIPGKFSNYLHYNKTILASISGPTKDFIIKYNLGLVSEPNDHASFKKNISYLYHNKKNLKKLNNSEILKKFNKEAILNFFEKKLKKILDNTNIIFSLISNSHKISYKKNFIIAALNLAFLSYYASKKIIFKKTFLLWPDGVFSKWISKTPNIGKLPGRELLKNLTIPSYIKFIHIIGNADRKSLSYISDKFQNKKLIHTKLPYGSIEILCKSLPKLRKNSLTLIVLPTPKQEQLANYLSLNNKDYKIICVGGALNMLSGSEVPVPQWLDRFNLEFLWRLRFDTKRRAARLFETFFIFMRYWFVGYFKNFKIKNDK